MDLEKINEDLDKVEWVSFFEAKKKKKGVRHPLGDPNTYLCLVALLGLIVMMIVSCASDPSHREAAPAHEIRDFRR